MILPDPALPWPIPMAAVALIAEREGLRLRAYRCPAGVWTIGRGRTAGVHPGDTCTVEQADRWLCDELTARSKSVLALCTDYPEPNQLGAMTSLHYNVGESAFSKSTVLRAHNRQDSQAAARAFALWNKARVNGVLTVLPGLTARRAAEAALYLTPEQDAPREQMPQAVEAEAPMRQSTTIQASSTIAGVGVVAGLAEAAGSVQGLGDALRAAKSVLTETLGIPPSWMLPMVLLAAAYVLVKDRLARRKDGWT